jgi:hypothetical protein
MLDLRSAAQIFALCLQSPTCPQRSHLTIQARKMQAMPAFSNLPVGQRLDL